MPSYWPVEVSDEKPIHEKTEENVPGLTRRHSSTRNKRVRTVFLTLAHVHRLWRRVLARLFLLGFL